MYNKNKTDCPRGFYFNKDKQECVPIQTGVEDKLILKAERYFFKENKDCPDGFHWCDQTNQCIEDDSEKRQGKGKGFGKGNGPVGVPKNEDVNGVFEKIKESEIIIDKILNRLEESNYLNDVTLSTIIMKYGIRASKMYNRCMDKAKTHPILSKNRAFAKATCKYNDAMYNVKQLKAHIGMCAQAKNPNKCKKQVLDAIKMDLKLAAAYAKRIKKLKPKLKKK